MTSYDDDAVTHRTFDLAETTFADAIHRAGLRLPPRQDETPQEAAERIWKSTACRRKGRGCSIIHDPVETMRLFSDWALESPDRMIAVLTRSIWDRAVRQFLDRRDGWPHGVAFQDSMYKLDRRVDQRTDTAKYKRRVVVESTTVRAKRKRNYVDRKTKGLKIIMAEVDTATGTVVNLIDKEIGPFAHIRINGLKLAEVTTEEALGYCDHKTADVRFIRALCRLILDPRKPIGEQWDSDMIREAREIAGRTDAA